MKLAMLNRKEEIRRLTTALDGNEGCLICLYGRRRCGKSRLLREVLQKRRFVYYVGDDRDASLQKRSVAKAIAEILPGFDRVDYPDWEALLDRWWQGAGKGGILAFDEFPSLVSVAPELPSLLQKKIDQFFDHAVHTIVCGSSQRMMQGLVLDRSAPLYGRAKEIIEIKPLGAYWLTKAFRFKDCAKSLETYSVWGGIPRYWELALDFSSHREAVRSLVMDPMGVLHWEPERLLLDDMREVTQAASVLSLIGRGCHRASEIAGRLEKPVTSLSRPLRRLVQLGLISRELPFGASKRDSKRSFYHINDSFLNFWFRYIEPNRSRLEAGQISSVEAEIRSTQSQLLGETWERLARAAVPYLEIGGIRWRPAGRWWGSGMDRDPMEFDIVALSEDKKALLVGEVKLKLSDRDRERAEASLLDRVRRFPLAENKRVIPCVWTMSARKPKGSVTGVHNVICEQVFSVLR